MKTIEIAQRIKEENSKRLGKMNEKKIAFVIRKALAEIKKEILNTDTDKTKIGIRGFGNFTIRMLEKEKEGKKEIIKRIVFRPSKTKENKEIK